MRVEYDTPMNDTKRYRAPLLAKILKSQGRHQRWLAAQIGVHESHLSRVISGEKTLTHEQAEKASWLLQVPLFLVFELVDQNEAVIAGNRIAS